MRNQCIARFLRTLGLPTTKMLFSDWHPSMQAPHPVQIDVSMVIAHCWPSERLGDNKEGNGPRPSAAKSGSERHSASVAERATGRPSVEKWTWVRASGCFCPGNLRSSTCLTNEGASDVRSG